MSQEVFRRSGTGKFMIAAPAREGAAAEPAPRALSPTQQKARALYEQALQDLERKALVSAETALRLSVTFDPQDPGARTLLERVKLQREAERRAQATLRIGR